TQAEINAGSVSSTATANATAGTGELLIESSTCMNDLARNPQIEIGKLQWSTPTVTSIMAQTTMRGEYRPVANSGNVDLTQVTVQDPAVPNDCVMTELGVAVTMSCNGTYSLTWADIRAGTRSNTAT
ncbi:unnamed protein product, partial [Sphacelaria rigidula]